MIICRSVNFKRYKKTDQKMLFTTNDWLLAWMGKPGPRFLLFIYKMYSSAACWLYPWSNVPHRQMFAGSKFAARKRCQVEALKHKVQRLQIRGWSFKIKHKQSSSRMGENFQPLKMMGISDRRKICRLHLASI